MNLLNGFYDAYSSLATDFLHVAKKHADPSLTPSIEAVDNADSAILSFLNGEELSITLAPRVKRPDDKVKMLPGQHAGVVVQYVDQKTGLIGRVNFYGGIRDPHHHLDTKDTDITRRRSHAARTDAVVSQPTHLNFHMLGQNETEPFLDVWITASPSEIRLSKFKFEEYHEVFRAIEAGDRRFRKIYTPLNRAMNSLMLMVPNPYSPR